jgi:hypothetical protein
MRDLAVLFVHLVATIARLAGPGGGRSVVAESVLVKQQLLILNRSRHRSPNLRVLRSRRRRLVYSPHASRPTDPLRNRIENSLEPSSSADEPQVPATVLAQTAKEVGPKRTWPGSHSSGCPDEATESNVGLSAYRPTNRFGFRYSNQQGCAVNTNPTMRRVNWSIATRTQRVRKGKPIFETRGDGDQNSALRAALASVRRTPYRYFCCPQQKCRSVARRTDAILAHRALF